MRERTLDVRAETIRHGEEPRAHADYAPAVSAKDDVDALASQPGSLVEAVVRPTRLLDGHDRRQERALRGRSTRRQLEQRRLVHPARAEAPNENRDAQPVAARACRSGDFEPGTLRCPDGSDEDAAVELRQAHAAPPPAGARERGHEERHSLRRRNDYGQPGHAERARREPERRQPRRVRRCQPEAQRRDERMWSAHRHGATTSRSWSRRFGPMPGIASSSSTLPNAPWCCRKSRIFCAVTGPTPGSASRSASVAEFRCTGPAGADGPPLPAPRAAATRTGTTIWLPSASGAARLTRSSCALRVAPPARASASAMRDPCGSR